MAENENQNAETNELSAEANELSVEAQELFTRKVALVRPLLRNGNIDGGRPRTTSSPSPSRPTSRTPPSHPSHDERWRPLIVPQPFSFDERDARQKLARERRLLELKQEEERQMMAAMFRANPIRKYKPVVLTPSTRPLTVPQTPFSHRRK